MHPPIWPAIRRASTSPRLRILPLLLLGNLLMVHVASASGHELNMRLLQSRSMPLHTPGSFDRPRIGVSPDGNIYLVEVFSGQGGERVQRFTAGGDFVDSWASSGIRQGQLHGTRDLAVDRDGRVLLLDGAVFSSRTSGSSPGPLAASRVQRFGPQGAFEQEWFWEAEVPQGKTGLPGIYKIAGAPDGSIFALESITNRVLHIDEIGSLVLAWSSPPSDERGYNDADQIAVAPNGDVLVAHGGQDVETATEQPRLLRFSPTGRQIWERGFGLGRDLEHVSMSGLDVAPNGTILLLDGESQRLIRLTSDGELIDVWPAGDAVDVAAGVDGSTYLVRSGSRAVGARITRHSDTGVQLDEIQSRPDLVDRRDHCSTTVGCMTASSREGIRFEFERIGDRYGVLRFDLLGNPDGEPILFGGEGTGPGEFTNCTDWTGRNPQTCHNHMAIAPDGSFFVTDHGNQRVHHFDMSGRWQREIVVRDEDGDPLDSAIHGLWIGPEMGLYLIHVGRLFRVDHDGMPEGTWRSTEWQIEGYQDLGFLPDGDLIAWRWERGGLGDELQHHMDRLTPRGELESTWRVPAEVYGLAVASEGRVWVFTPQDEPKARLFSPDGAEVGAATFEEDLDEWENRRDWGPSGGRFDREGNLQARSVYGIAGSAATNAWYIDVHDNPWLADWPVTRLRWATLNVDFGDHAPIPILPADGFSLRAERSHYHLGGRLDVDLRADGGARLWVDELLLIDDRHATDLQTRASAELTPGWHRLRIEYRDPGGRAGLSLQTASSAEIARLYLPHLSKPSAGMGRPASANHPSRIGASTVIAAPTDSNLP